MTDGDKTIKLRVIDRYENDKYVDEELDVHVCYVHIRYTNSKGEVATMNMTADEFRKQYELVKK